MILINNQKVSHRSNGFFGGDRTSGSTGPTRHHQDQPSADAATDGLLQESLVRLQVGSRPCDGPAVAVGYASHRVRRDACEAGNLRVVKHSVLKHPLDPADRPSIHATLSIGSMSCGAPVRFSAHPEVTIASEDPDEIGRQTQVSSNRGVFRARVEHPLGLAHDGRGDLRAIHLLAPPCIVPTGRWRGRSKKSDNQNKLSLTGKLFPPPKGRGDFGGGPGPHDAGRLGKFPSRTGQRLARASAGVSTSATTPRICGAHRRNAQLAGCIAV